MKTCFRCKISKNHEDYGNAGYCRSCCSEIYYKRPEVVARIAEQEQNKINRVKVCTNCKELKSYNEYGKHSIGVLGLKAECRACRSAYNRSKYEDPEFRQGKLDYAKARRIESGGQINRDYVELNRDAINARDAEKYATDFEYKLKKNLRARTNRAFKAQEAKKSGKTMDFLGCNGIELVEWLSKNFQEGMTIENHGKFWDIDHVIPCSAWDFKNPDHVKACFHWTNLQPLESKKNRWEKGGAERYPKGHFRPAIAERLLVLRCMDVIA